MSSNTWRQYGGTRKQNQFHNLTTGTLVVDQILIRESYAGKFKIPGSIFVGADVNAAGNVYAYGSSINTFDSYTGKNSYIKKNLYFGTDLFINDIDLLNHAYMAGNFTNKTIGINSQNPVSSFDIRGADSTQTQILSVSSLNTQINNTIGQNVNKHGVVVSANDNNAAVSFFVDKETNLSLSPDAYIEYTKGGTFKFGAANININSSINTTIRSSASTYLNAQILTNITAGQSVSITTANTNILSKLAISNRGQPSNIYNESTIIYDIPNGLYLYDAYENMNALAGSALTLLATDNKTNTFLRLVDTSNKGLSISAGSYPNDQTRTISSFGISDNTGKYRVNQTIVSGNSTVKYYTTTGFNTYAPRTENYVMDINGPTHISNGEINKMAEFNFEVLKTSFSKTVRNFGISAGTPSPKITVNSLPRNPQYISYTNDSGVTWTPVRIDATGDFEEGIPKNFTVYTHDDKFAILGSVTGILYYTKDGGKNWVNMSANDYGNDDPIRVYQTLFLNPTKINNKNRLFSSLTRTPRRGGASELCIFYADLNLDSLPSLTSLTEDGKSYTLQNTSDTANKAFNEEVVNVAMKNIYASDGFNNSIYFVGTGINKYNMTTVDSEYLKNTGNTYFGVHCYSNTYAVTVGATITMANTVTAAMISYTKNGTDWFNSTLPSELGPVILRSVHLFDPNNGMAVGDNGTFLYTRDGAVNWFIVPDSILNSSGYSSRINGSYNQLRNVYMVDTNIMSIASVKQTYLLNSPTAALSKVYMCYLPNLYNASTNNIFDVSGNMTISGNIDINDGGNLNTNCQAFNLINKNAKTVNFAGDATLINIGNNNTPSITNLYTGLKITGATTFQSTVNMSNDLEINGKLTVKGEGDSSIEGRLIVEKKAIFNNGIHVFGNIEHQLDFNYLNRLYVEQDAFLYQRVFVGGDASFTGNVDIGGPVIISGTVSIVNEVGIITLNNKMIDSNTNLIYDTFQSNQSAQSLEIGTVVSYGNIFPAGTYITNISKIEAVSGNAVTLIGNKYFDSQNTEITGDVLNGQIITLSQKPSILSQQPINISFQNSKIFTVYPDTSLNSRLYIGGDTSLNSRLYVKGDVSLNSRLSVINDVSLGGNINIGNNNGIYANITTKGITYQSNPNTYYNLPFSQFNFIQSLAEDVQNRLYDLTLRTNNINVTNSAPSNLTLMPAGTTNNNIQFSFSNFPNASSYNVYLNGINITTNTQTGEGPYIFSNTTNNNTQIYTISGLQSLTYYSIQVSAITNQGVTIKSPALIGGSTTRSFNIDVSEDYTDIIDPTTFDVTSIDPSAFGVNDIDFSSLSQMSNSFMPTIDTTRDTLSALLTFDVAGNNLLFSGNLEPTTPSNLMIGSQTYPFTSLFVNDQNAIYFMSQNLSNQGTMTFNLSTGYLDLSCNGLTGSTLLAYGGNVAIGKPLPNTTLDVLGQSTFNGDINHQTGNLYLNNRLFVQSDLSLAGNLFSGKNLFQMGDTFLRSRLFVIGDTSINSNLFVNKDTSLNQKLYVANDASLNSNLYVGNNVNIIGKTTMNNQLIVQGTTAIASDVSIGSNLYVNNKTVLNKDLSLNGNITINGSAYLNSDQYLQGNLFVINNQYLNGNILINGTTNNIKDVYMSSRLFIEGDASLNRRLFLSDTAYLNNDVFIKSNAYITKNLTLNGNLSITGNSLTMNGTSSFNGNVVLNNYLDVTNNTSLNGDVFINGSTIQNSDVQMKGFLYLTKDASFSSNLYVNNKLITNNDASINANVIASGRVVSNGDLVSNSRLLVSNNTILGSTLTVQGLTTLNSDASINGNIFGKNTITSGNSLIKGSIILNGDASFGSNLLVGNKAIISGDTNISGNLNVNNIANRGSLITQGTNTTYGDVNLISNLLVNKNTILNGPLSVRADTNVSGNVIVANDLSVNGRIFVGSYPPGSIPIGAIAGGAGLALGSFAADVNIGKNFYVGGDTVFYGNLTIVKDLTLLGQIVIKQYTVNQVITTLSYEVIIAEDLSLNGRLFMTGDGSFNGRLFVEQDVSLNANLYVGGKTTFAQPITIDDTLTVNGEVITNNRITNNKLSVFNGDISLNARFYVAGNSNFINDVSINNRLFVKNDSSLNGNLYTFGLSVLNSDVSINNRLFVRNDISLNANLYTFGRSVLNSDVSINNKLYVQNDTSLNGKLYTFGQVINRSDVSMNNRLYVQNDVSLNANLYVNRQIVLNGDVSMNARLYVNNDVSMSSNLYVNKQTILNGDVSMNSNVSLNSNLYVNFNSTQNGDVSMNNRLYVAKDASINSNLFVGGKSIFQNDASFNSTLYGVDASFTGNIAIYGNLYLRTDLRFDSMYLKKNLSVIGNIFMTGQSTQMVDASLSGNLNVLIDTSLNGRLAVANDVSFNNNINVLRDTSLNSRLFIGGDSSLNANLFVNGNTIHNGDVSMVSSLDLNGTMISRNNMNVYGIINQYSTNPTPSNTIINNTSYVSSSASQVTLGTSASQIVYVPGNIGIGTSNPLVPLYINKSSLSTGQDNGYYISNGSSNSSAINTSMAYNYSIYALNSIATSDKLIATSSVYFSDERIKTKIEDIDYAQALEKIRQLKPKKYNYIDNIGQGSESTLGFIAQEVKPIINNSVSISKNFIPNIYELCKIENQLVTLQNKNTEILNAGSKIKAISKTGTEILFVVSQIHSEKTFTIEKFENIDSIVNDSVFIYGQEIDDFNNLDKNAIFTITTAALKQVDKELQDTKNLVEQQKLQIKTLEIQMQFINDKLQFF